ncbi:MAG: transposase [Acidobacteria bacterium]|nr:transposase [Acidobacteriota bacterium]MCB9399444.1 transposase [Acidobacteriota bacterium]
MSKKYTDEFKCEAVKLVKNQGYSVSKAAESLGISWPTLDKSISWVMRCLNEWVARKANREDGCKGRFWEGRYTAVALLDNAAILTCSAYIDLNPIRAGIAETPEESDYTSAQDRILARQAGQNLAQLPESLKMNQTLDQAQLIEEMQAQLKRADWLCPIRSNESRKGFLNLDLDDFLALLDWTGRQIRADKPGAIPAHFEAILERLEIDQAAWLDTVQHFGSRFHRVAGNVKRLMQPAREAGQHWFQVKTAAQRAFTPLRQKPYVPLTKNDRSKNVLESP